MNELHDKRFVVIGVGNIGRILIGRLQAEGVPAAQITVCEPDPERSATASAVFGVRAAPLDDEQVCGADVLLLAMPPNAALETLRAVGDRLSAGQVVVSFAAAVPLERLEAAVPAGVELVRVMPNAPSLVGEGMNPVAYGEPVTAATKALVGALLAALGRSIEVRDEQMNWCVGLSGAAMRSLLPALEGMAQAGIEAGLPAAEARGVAAQVMAGTAALVQRTGLGFDEIKALTPMETVDEEALAGLFLGAARGAKEKIDRLEAKLWRVREPPG